MRKLLGLALLAAAGCGGNGTKSNAPDDQIPPEVISRSPSPGSIDVWVHQAILVTFSEPIDFDSLGESNVILRAGGSIVPKTFTLVDASTLLIQPTGALPTPSTVEVILGESITDVAGNGLVLPAGTWTWQVPRWLTHGGPLDGNSAASTPAKTPTVALGSDGRLFVAWIEAETGDGDSVYVRRWNGTAMEAIGGPLDAITGAGSNVYSAALAVAPQGRPVVAFSELDAGGVHMHVARWDGAAWEPLGNTIDMGGDMLSFDIDVEIDGAGNPVIAWNESGATATDVYVSRWTGTSWSNLGGALSAVGGASNALEPSMELDDQGDPIIAWAEDTEVRVRSWNGASWDLVGGGNVSTNGGTTSAFSPSLQRVANGDLFIAFAENNPTFTSVFAKHFTGGAWTDIGGVVGLNASPATHIYMPSLGLNSLGLPVVAWYQDAGSGTYDVHLREIATDSWLLTDSGMLSAAAGATDALLPELVTDAYGAPAIAWQENGAAHVWRLNR